MHPSQLNVYIIAPIFALRDVQLLLGSGMWVAHLKQCRAAVEGLRIGVSEGEREVFDSLRFVAIMPVEVLSCSSVRIDTIPRCFVQMSPWKFLDNRYIEQMRFRCGSGGSVRRNLTECTLFATCRPVQVVVSATSATQKLAWMRDGDLDATIWKNLPEEVLERIFALLPFPNLFRCATICKKWRMIAQSPLLRLTRASSIVTPWPSYCLVRYSQRESGALHWSGFCTDTNKWQDMPRISIPTCPGKCVITGSGGLLAIYKPGTVLVCNPITGQQRELPRTNQKWSWPNVLHMVTDDVQGSYTIILAGTEAYSIRKLQATEVYDSVTNKWVVTGSLPAGMRLDTQDAALDNGLLYCTAQKVYVQAEDNLVGTDALVAFDIHRGVWSEVANEFPDDSARQTPLVCGGRIVMAVAPVDDDGPVGCFYALNAVTKHWELIASMPEVMHRRVRPWGACAVSGNDIVVVSDSAQGCVVSYDMAWGTWCERKAPIKFTKSNRPSAKEVRLLATVSFRPDANATP
uniref:F-box domain-containing protein n=2 Tax=Physcomitrium patens TaxID=3218 RepID=A0A2K1JI02_PHYPA|nr:hypothetical protein PHYPA_018586 [Physcomitrium patens]